MVSFSPFGDGVLEPFGLTSDSELEARCVGFHRDGFHRPLFPLRVSHALHASVLAFRAPCAQPSLRSPASYAPFLFTTFIHAVPSAGMTGPTHRLNE